MVIRMGDKDVEIPSLEEDITKQFVQLDAEPKANPVAGLEEHQSFEETEKAKKEVDMAKKEMQFNK